jgi:S-DNA-T family DNA segregation ATPase FtsK/SpoIIIE
LLKGKPPVDWQAALPVAGETEWEQISRLTELAEQMRAAWTGPLPEPILNLPDHVVLTNLLEGPKAPAPFFSPLGIGFDSLDPVGFSLSGDGPTFLIAGSTPQSGKTTLLRTWLLGLSQRYSPERIRFILVDFHTRTLKRFRKDPHTAAYIGQASELNDALQDLLADIKARASEADRCNREDPDAFERSRWLEQLPMTVVVIDDYEKFSLQCESERRLLADCLMQGGELGMAFIAAGNATELPRDYDDPLIQKMRKHGCGVLLNGITEIDQFNNARLPAFQKPGGMPPGRGYLIRRGRVQLFQSAAYWEADSSPKEALACLTGQAGG